MISSIKTKLGVLVGAALLPPLIAFLLGELALRQRFERIEAITGVAAWEQGQFVDLTYLWDQYHSSYGWTNRPSYQSDARVPFRLTINSQSLRAEHTYSPSPAPGTRRIAIFGDSCTFGEEVDDDQTLPVYLEQALQNVEVLNFGVHGFGLGQMMLRLEEEGFEFQPDHVVVVIMLPHGLLRDAMSFFVHSKPVFSTKGSELQITNLPVSEASRLPWIYRSSYVAAWLFARFEQPPRSETVEDILETTALLVERIDAQCRERGIGFTLVAIVVQPVVREMQLNAATQRMVRRMRRSLSKLDVDVVDQVDILVRAVSKRASALTMKLGHWSAAGNCLIADRIAQHLAETHSDLSLGDDPLVCGLRPAAVTQSVDPRLNRPGFAGGSGVPKREG